MMATYEFKCDECGTMAIINRTIDADGDVVSGVGFTLYRLSNAEAEQLTKP